MPFAFVPRSFAFFSVITYGTWNDYIVHYASYKFYPGFADGIFGRIFLLRSLERMWH